MECGILDTISAYTPQQGGKLTDGLFHGKSGRLNYTVRRTPEAERLVIGGDINGHVGESVEGYEESHGGWGYGIRNAEDG